MTTLASSLSHRLQNKTITEPNSGCWLWTGCFNQKGYGRISVSGRKTKATHRVSWELNFGKIPEGMLVCHKCDVPSCVNPSHLFLGTPKDNNQDMLRKGRQSSGLTAEQVVEIRRLKNVGFGVMYLSKIFDVGHATISRICKRQRWLHIVIALIALHGCDNYVGPPSWTLRADGILRRELTDEECQKLGQPNGCKEEFTVAEFIKKIEQEEQKRIGICLSPAGAAEISNEIKSCHIDLESCKASCK